MDFVTKKTGCEWRCLTTDQQWNRAKLRLGNVSNPISIATVNVATLQQLFFTKLWKVIEVIRVLFHVYRIIASIQQGPEIADTIIGGDHLRANGYLSSLELPKLVATFPSKHWSFHTSFSIPPVAEEVEEDEDVFQGLKNEEPFCVVSGAHYMDLWYVYESEGRRLSAAPSIEEK